LKLQLDEALNKHREQVPLWPDLKMNDPEYEIKLENILDLAQARKSNKELQFLYHLGKYFSTRLERINLQQKTHLVGIFLFDYFEGEEDAILYLEDVTMHNIYYISSQDHNTILLLKPATMNHESPPYEPQEPDWITMFSPLDLPPSPQHPLSVSEMWHAPANPSISTKCHYDAEDLEDSDEPLFLTCLLDPSLLATSSLLLTGATRGLDSHEISDRSAQKHHRF